MNSLTKTKIFIQKTAATILLSAIILSSFSLPTLVASASTVGINLNNSNLTVEKNLRVNFVVSAVLDGTTTTPGTYFFVSDNGGGDFYDGTTGGACNNETPDADNHFSLSQNKGVCYSNSTAGSYIINVQLRSAINGSNIGEPQTISVTVTEPVSATSTAELRIQKVVIGGTAVPADFTMSATASGNEYDFSDIGDSSKFHTVLADTVYAMSESSIDGYELTDISCVGSTAIQNINQGWNDITLAEDDKVTCTFTNTHEDYDNGREVITACKYNPDESPVVGWGMLITNLEEGEGEVTFDDLLTDDEGCVTVSVYPEDGPFVVVEEDRAGWSYVSHSAYNGYTTNEVDDVPTCVFFDEEGDYDNAGDSSEYSCTFVNVQDAPQCVDGQKDWADSVHWALPGKLKNGNNITDPNRTNPEATLGASDWVANGSTGFFSLGFGGSIKVAFDNFVVDTEGNDISIHEATNGSNYPLEKAEVWVSQNGDDWFMIGHADNTSGDRVTYLDIASSGLSWIQFVKVIDVTDPALHDATADGFDLDAVDATESVCSEPEDEDPVGACEIEGHKYDSEGNPLEGWFIGLKKFATYGEIEQSYTILNDTTDKSGYYCLEWDNVDFSEVEPGYDSFFYRIFEKLKIGWKFLSIEEGPDYENLTVVSEEDTWYGEGEVGTQFGEMNGYIPGNTSYHVDFYNMEDDDESDGRYTLNVSIIGEGEGDVDSTDLLINCSSQGDAIDCTETYASGTVVDITVVPAEGSNFDNSWSAGFGTCTGNATPCQVVMTQNVNLVAHFDLDSSSNGGSGSGGRRNSSSGRAIPTVAGISDSEPQSLVLGDQVSVVPYGAANTGAGGTAQDESFSVTAIIAALLSVFISVSFGHRIFG